MGNHIKVGDILISFSKFQVVIGRAVVKFYVVVHSRKFSTWTTTRTTTWTRMTRTTSPQPNGLETLRFGGMQTKYRIPVGCALKQAPPCPHFLLTIRPSSYPWHLSLAAPGHFWDLHGNKLECNDCSWTLLRPSPCRWPFWDLSFIAFVHGNMLEYN